MVSDALNYPRARYAYIALTKESAEGIVWKELEDINDKYGLRLHLMESRLRAEFPNGAELSLYGADRPEWMKKFKGRKFRMVVIDEAGEYDIDLRDFIFRVISPCLTDLLGSLWLIGTPGIIQDGYWWDVTNPDPGKRDPGWSYHWWDKYDNPYIVEQWKIELNELIQKYGPDVETQPWFLREHRGKWVVDTGDNVYEFQDGRNTCDTAKDDLPPSTKYILGVDHGVDDATAFIVGAYGPDIPDLIYLECYKRKGMHFDEIAKMINSYMDEYPGMRVIADPNSKRFMYEMVDRYRLPVENADKFSNQKPYSIQVYNNDAMAGRIKINSIACSGYIKELLNLKKQRRPNGEWKEHPTCPNDICDAALYIHKETQHWRHTQPVIEPEFGSWEHYERVSKNLKRKAETRILKQQSREWWE